MQQRGNPPAQTSPILFPHLPLTTIVAHTVPVYFWKLLLLNRLVAYKLSHRVLPLPSVGKPTAPLPLGVAQFLTLPLIYNQAEHCTMYSVGFGHVFLARHSKSKLFLCTCLVATFSVLLSV